MTKTTAVRNLLEEHRDALLQADMTTAILKNGICYDGIVEEAVFESLPKKVAFLLKETNGNDPSGVRSGELSDWDYRAWLQEKQAVGMERSGEKLYRTFYSLCMWIDVFYDTTAEKAVSFEDYCADQRSAPENLRKNLAKTAIVNLKKTWGGGSTKWKDLYSYLQNDIAKEVIQKQLDIIDSDIVICGGREVFDFARQIFGTQEKTLSMNGGKTISYFKSNGKIFLDFYHPACRKSREFLYDFSAEVFRTLKNSRKEVYLPHRSRRTENGMGDL